MKKLEDLLDGRVAIGKIINHHGLNGEVKFFPYTNMKELIYNISDVLLYNPEKKKFFFSKIVNVRPLNKLRILQFRGIDSISSADKMKGFELYIEKEALPELEKDEYYLYELQNCSVYYEDDEFVGEVKDVLQTGANEVLVVEKQLNRFENEEVLIPVIKDFIVEINKKDKKIIVKRMTYDESDDKH